MWIRWTSIFKFITKIKQKQKYTTTPPTSSFGIWVKAGLRPHHSEILIVLCIGYVPLFSRIRIRLKTQASSQWTPPINLIGFCPCCWKFKLAELTAYESLGCSTPHGTKWSKRQLSDAIFGFNPNTGWFLNFRIHHGPNSQNSLTGTTIKWRMLLPTREEHILNFAINHCCCWSGRIFL